MITPISLVNTARLFPPVSPLDPAHQQANTNTETSWIPQPVTSGFSPTHQL